MILITGGAGYIGSHCALALLEQGNDIIIFDSTSFLVAPSTVAKQLLYVRVGILAKHYFMQNSKYFV